MTSDRWRKVEELYHAARDQGRDKAAAFLEQACGSDARLKHEVEALLAHDTSVEAVLDHPAWEASPAADPLHAPGLAKGKHFGAYRIESQLGSGGMGVVYRAVDSRLGRPVAIKISAERYSDRFEREARAVAALNHPHICTLYDVGADYLVMEFIEGETLRDRIRNGPLPIEEALGYAAQIADALAEAHAHGVVHRDLKPANIMLTRNGVKVLDFGIARMTAPIGDTATQTMGIVGTPAYMAPEQAAGKQAGPQADLFALGLILYEMITGRLPVPGASLGTTLESGTRVEIPPLSRLREHVPAGLQPIVASLLQRDPARRPQTAAEVKGRILSLNLGKSVLARRIAVAAVLALVIAAGIWSAFRAGSRGGPAAPMASVAVLPFLNNTGDASVEYMVDGTTSDLIRRLAFVPQLRVISAASVMALKGKDLTPTAAAQRLGVDTIITGSIRGASRNAAIDVEVSHGRDGSVFFARHYAPQEPDLQRLLSTVAEDLTTGMKVRLDRGLQNDLRKPLTKNPAALDSYLRAEPLLSSDDPRLIGQGLELLSGAIQKDPQFALATSELAAAHLSLGLYFDDPRRHMPEAKALARRALDLDETLRVPHGILGLIALVYEWDYDEARRQLILSSGRMEVSALQQLACSAHLLSMSGRWDHNAEDEIHSALEANPIAANLVSELGCGAYYARKYDRALQGFTRALTIQPSSVNAIWGLGKTYAQMGKFQEALDALDRAPGAGGFLPPPILGEQGYIYGRMKNSQQAHRILDRLNEMSGKVFVDPFFRAEVYLGLGDIARTMDALNEAFATRSAILISIHTDPKWDVLQRDRRFQELAARVGGN